MEITVSLFFLSFTILAILLWYYDLLMVLNLFFVKLCNHSFSYARDIHELLFFLETDLSHSQSQCIKPFLIVFHVYYVGYLTDVLKIDFFPQTILLAFSEYSLCNIFPQHVQKIIIRNSKSGIWIYLKQIQYRY